MIKQGGNAAGKRRVAVLGSWLVCQLWIPSSYTRGLATQLGWKIAKDEMCLEGLAPTCLGMLNFWSMGDVCWRKTCSCGGKLESLTRIKLVLQQWQVGPSRTSGATPSDGYRSSEGAHEHPACLSSAPAGLPTAVVSPVWLSCRYWERHSLLPVLQQETAPRRHPAVACGDHLRA